MSEHFSSSPRVAWVGVGAIGLLYGASLARAGVETHLLLRSDYDAAMSGGIGVRSIDGDFRVPPGAFHGHQTSGSIPTPDLVVVSTKTTANGELPEILRPMVGAGTYILTLQNGLGNEACLAEHFGGERVLGGMAYVSVHRIAPATAEHQHGGRLTIGRFAGPPNAGTEAVAGLLRRTGFPVEVLPSLTVGRWDKQLWNIPFNGLGAAMGANTEVLLRTDEGRSLVRGVMREVVAVARSEGVGERDLPDSLIESKIRFTLGMGPYRTSMQLDRESGRPMEIDSIIGSVLRLAKNHSISTPLLEVLQVQLRAIDAATRAAP